VTGTGAPLHAALGHVAALLGTWSGEGAGEYPTIDAFRYVESVTFAHVSKPFLAYSQRTRELGPEGVPGLPLHAERGYWRFPAADRAELVLAHPSGIVEIDEGAVRLDGDELVIDVASTVIATTSTAKEVVAVERTFRLGGDVLTYTVRMAAVGRPMQHHLAATLRRDAPATATPPA
jgi:hypothetical protein